MSIGDYLAQARSQAGLTVTQVSQRTCIRETIIRGIEHDDYLACGGDFYARGHIRSIARAVGADPEPLVRDYDESVGAPQAISAADVFEPATPIKIRDRHRPNWSLALAVALAAIVGFAAYHEVSARGPAHDSPAASRTGVPRPVQHQPVTPTPAPPAPTRPAATPAASASRANQVEISLQASQDCWVDLTTVSGTKVYSGMMFAGASMQVVQPQAVSLMLGNPRGVSLAVNGKKTVTGTGSQPVTLRLGPGRDTPS